MLLAVSARLSPTLEWVELFDFNISYSRVFLKLKFKRFALPSYSSSIGSYNFFCYWPAVSFLAGDL